LEEGGDDLPAAGLAARDGAVVVAAAFPEGAGLPWIARVGARAGPTRAARAMLAEGPGEALGMGVATIPLPPGDRPPGGVGCGSIQAASSTLDDTRRRR